MKRIIDPIDRNLLLQELLPERFILHTHKGDNEIYRFSFHDSPHLMMEVARLREVSSRAFGGGSGGIVDIDDFDTQPNSGMQLIIWNPANREIVGGFRYFSGIREIYKKQNGNEGKLVSSFRFSDTFKQKYLAHSIEIDHVFVRPEYQSVNFEDNFSFGLDNLREGLAALNGFYPDAKYILGTMVTFPHFNSVALEEVLRFMHVYFSGKESLAIPVNPLITDFNKRELRSLFLGTNFNDDYRFMVQRIRQLGEILPPLFSAIVKMSSDISVLGTSKRGESGYAETAMLFNLRDRHLSIDSKYIRQFAYQLRKMDYSIPGDF